MALGIDRIEFAMCLHLSLRATEPLAERAASSGKDVAGIASDLIEHAVGL